MEKARKKTAVLTFGKGKTIQQHNFFNFEQVLQQSSGPHFYPFIQGAHK